MSTSLFSIFSIAQICFPLPLRRTWIAGSLSTTSRYKEREREVSVHPCWPDKQSTTHCVCFILSIFNISSVSTFLTPSTSFSFFSCSVDFQKSPRRPPVFTTCFSSSPRLRRDHNYTLYLPVGVQVSSRDLKSDQVLCSLVKLLRNEAGLLSQQVGSNYLLLQAPQAASHHRFSTPPTDTNACFTIHLEYPIFLQSNRISKSFTESCHTCPHSTVACVFGSRLVLRKWQHH